MTNSSTTNSNKNVLKTIIEVNRTWVEVFNIEDAEIAICAKDFLDKKILMSQSKIKLLFRFLTTKGIFTTWSDGRQKS